MICPLASRRLTELTTLLPLANFVRARGFVALFLLENTP